MNERVRRLRNQSLQTDPTLSIERAILVTEAYKQYQGKVSLPVLRALALKHLLSNKAIVINDDELIVGERGPKPQAASTFPELCCHTVEDFRVIDKREKIFFRVDEETLRQQEQVIIPFWQGKAMRDLIMDQMTQEWRDCYEAGIYTEFMEQRAPGHTVCDDKVYKNGMRDFKARIARELASLDYIADPAAYEKQEQWKAMDICCDALIIFAKRHAAEARRLAQTAAEPRRSELLQIAATCEWVPANAPRTFREALQMYWFVHLGVITELNNWDAYCPGHLDHHLFPFYKAEIEAGSLNRNEAKELVECFWVKFNNQPAPPKVGITLKESGTYTDFCNINIGGILPDGSDGVNEISYLLLEVIEDMRTLQPSTNVQISRKNPDKFVIEAAKVIREGMGFPSVFNTDSVVEELLRQGKSIEDARAGGTSGCVEVGAFGKEAYILTGYFNMVKVLEVMLNNGVDPRSGKQIGPQTGDPRNFKNLDDLLAAFEKQMQYFIDVDIRGNNVIEALYAKYMPAPFLSVLTDDCIAKGRDYNNGGARYNTRYIQFVGLGNLTDCLSSIQKHVYSDGTLDMNRLLAILKDNFEGYEKERQLFLNKTPKYGNDDDRADSLIMSMFEILYKLVNGRPTMTGGYYRVEMLPTTCHVYFGEVCGATPDGRKAKLALSEGISPVQGADKHGPTAVIKSAAKLDHQRTGGTLLNQKFSPSVLSGETGLDGLKNLIRTYFRLDGHHIQFNVVSSDTLREAQENPENYSDLIVRVAGYSDYFNNLTTEMQNEIIDRTEQQNF
ncbi:MAG: glycyl radical protein [Defluviitaleaceae bacterium]|nr:glycyl radical protein [Defluviitaleaceae bacterium]